MYIYIFNFKFSPSDLNNSFMRLNWCSSPSFSELLFISDECGRVMRRGWLGEVGFKWGPLLAKLNLTIYLACTGTCQTIHPSLLQENKAPNYLAVWGHEVYLGTYGGLAHVWHWNLSFRLSLGSAHPPVNQSIVDDRYPNAQILLLHDDEVI